MNLKDLKIGDIIVITIQMRHGTDQWCAEVTALNYNNLGLVQFGPCRYKDFLHIGYGSFDPSSISKKRFGKQAVEIVNYATSC